MIVMITGSRHWKNWRRIRDRIAELPHDTQVVVGDAKGADRWAATAARECGLALHVYKANWERYGPGAGPMRNMQMINTNPELVIAFRAAGKSNGTNHAITQAHKRGIPVELIEE